MKLVQDRWRDRECPIFNGLLLYDGTRRTVDLSRERHASGTRLTIDVGDIEWDESWISKVGNQWASLIVRCELNLGAGMIVECGEGSYGGDGFISLTDSRGDLIWLLFSDESNPFVHLERRGKHLMAISSLAEVWDIPIEEPERVKAAATEWVAPE